MTDLESLGLPSVGVASTEFIDAAASQSRALGFAASMIFVPHPIQDRTDEELRALADQAIEEIVRALTAH